ncbi:MAG: alginate export family protein [Holophagae bacterium]|nr:alginate export family protein [Holophagae bacterium]
MPKCVCNALKIFVLVMFTTTPLLAGDSLTDALTNGTTSMQIKFSYEYSDLSDAANLDTAQGGILRTRLGYKTADFNGMSAFVQFHNVSLLQDDFSWPGGGDTSCSDIADPDGTRVHQIYLDFSLGQHVMLRAGRQEINLDDARLIGDLDFRQNGQSFDALKLTFTGIDNNELSVSYITRVNTIFFSHVTPDQLFLIHDTYKPSDHVSITAFGYLLDTESEIADSRDSATYGTRVTADPGRFHLDFTYALQGDYGDGENHDADMIMATATVKLGKWTVGGGANIFSGQDGDTLPFDTLCSSAHAFNGWADQFAGSNGGSIVNGLQDVFVQASTSFSGVKFLTVFHWFDTTDANTYDGTYGNELDILFKKKFNDYLSGEVKLAFYNAENAENNPTVDEKVLWIRLNYQF